MTDEQYAAMLKGFADLAGRIADLSSRMDRRFEVVDERFDAIDRRFDDVYRRFDEMGYRFDIQDSAHQKVIDTIGMYVDRMDKRWHKKWTDHDQRLVRLEHS